MAKDKIQEPSIEELKARIATLEGQLAVQFGIDRDIAEEVDRRRALGLSRDEAITAAQNQFKWDRELEKNNNLPRGCFKNGAQILAADGKTPLGPDGKPIQATQE